MSGAGQVCVGWALGICSAIALPGATPAPADHPVAIEIEQGDPPRWRERLAWGPYRVADADLFAFAMPALATFTCVDRRRVLVSAAPGAGEGDIAAMLIATVLPALLWARGEILLHAAAAIGAGADAGALVVAPSGGGKSTLLSRALRRGASAIADDSVCLRIAGDRIMASGLPGGVWVSRSQDRAFAPTPAARQRIEAPVDRLLVIEPDCAQRRTLTGMDAFATLLRHRHRPRIAALLGTEPSFIAPLHSIVRGLRMTAVPPLSRTRLPAGREG